MSFRDLCVLVDGTSAATRRLDVALRLGRHFGARVTALALIAEPFLRNGHHLPEEIVREHLGHARADAEAVFLTARTSAERIGAELETHADCGPLDRLPSLFARRARNADMVIVGTPNAEERGTDDALLVETAFMETGRPALVVPAAGIAALPFRRVLVAWNGAREATRAVHDSMPLLRDAEEVVVLIVDLESQGIRFDARPGDGIAGHLVRHGVAARVKQVQSGGAAVASAIVAQAEAEGCDLLVMGGYSHSRLRELILGGVTRHMLDHAGFPVLLAH